ncbi:MAG: diacylglycerol/lipid kinase family protein [Candidatus Binatia bacterium]
MAGIGVVVNPLAGRNRRAGDRADRLGDVLGAQGWVRETASLEHLADVAAECRARAVDVLGVCGGDGTLARTLSALVRVYGSDALPRILPLRAGTMNTVARAMGCSSWQPERMLAEVAADYRRGRPLALTEHQLVAVNARAFGFMVGVGVPVEFLRLYYDLPQRGGRPAAGLVLRMAASALRGGPMIRRVFAPMRGVMRCDGVSAPFDHFTVIYASTIEDIGLGFRPTYRARERAGQFHVFAGPIGAREFLRCMPAIRRARPTGSAHVHDALASRLAVEFQQPTFYMIDGDIIEATTRLTVSGGPVVRVIRR